MFWKVIATAGLLVMLMPGKALAVQYPPESTTTTTNVVPTTLTSVVLTVPPKKVTTAQNKPRGALAKTGADSVATAVRVGVVLVVAGFVIYLAGRNRRAIKK